MHLNLFATVSLDFNDPFWFICFI